LNDLSQYSSRLRKRKISVPPAESLSIMTKHACSRRRFMGLCSASLGLLAEPASSRSSPTPFARVALRDRHSRPITVQALEAERDYLFFYPYVCTPCFLLRLARPADPVQLETAAGEVYRWHGGVGPKRSVVAFAAICSHRLTYPAEAVSFIGYRKKPVGFLAGQRVERRGSVIQCCSEHSLYDPGAGARVLSGPAPQPLASIALETDASGALYAGGVYGGTLYERFFERFGFQLEMEFGQQARSPVEDAAEVQRLDDYTRTRIQC
jgi:Rieske Fe-S protein